LSSLRLVRLFGAIPMVNPQEDIPMPSSKETSARWRVEADLANPAGPLFVGGEHAAADIVCETGTGSGMCGTVCTGSVKRYCC
jgi:uncharacterized protein DUF6229